MCFFAFEIGFACLGSIVRFIPRESFVTYIFAREKTCPFRWITLVSEPPKKKCSNETCIDHQIPTRAHTHTPTKYNIVDICHQRQGPQWISVAVGNSLVPFLFVTYQGSFHSGKCYFDRVTFP